MIEAVGNGVFRKEKYNHVSFQDTSSSLYRFVRRTESAVLDKLENVVLSPFTQRSFDMPEGYVVLSQCLFKNAAFMLFHNLRIGYFLIGLNELHNQL